MLAENIDNINEKYIIINDAIKNSVLQHSNFYKLSYSNDIISFNGIFVLVNINKILYNNIKSFKIEFNHENNIDIINKINTLEKKILDLLNIKDKERQYKITEIFKSNNFKYTLNDNDIEKKINFKNEISNNLFIIKISGIWETREKYGITFKIYYINKIINLLPVS